MCNILDYFLRRNHEERQARAIELVRGREIPESADRQIVEAIHGPDALDFGALDLSHGARELLVGRQHADRHNVIIGSTGSGKTRFWLAIVWQKLRRAIRRRLRGEGIRLCDAKGETAKLLMAFIVVLWRSTDDVGRAFLQSSLHCVIAEGSRVTPRPVYAQVAGKSNAYLAEVRAETFDRASSISGQMRHVMFVVFWVMVELETPLSYKFAVRFLRDAAFRSRVRDRIPDPVLRDLIDAVPSFARATIEAVLRVLVMFVSYPAVRAAVSVPPAVLRKLGLPLDPQIIIGDFSSSGSVPRSIALALARWFMVDTLFEAEVGDTSTHTNIAVEEVSALVAEIAGLTEMLLNAYRTFRSRNKSITSLLQSLEGLPKSVAHEILLNSHWSATFASGSDAANLLFPHVTADPRDRRRESERSRAFAKSVQALGTREYYLWVKTNGVFRLTSPMLDDPGPESVDELVEIFHREVAPSSTISIAEAERHLAEWEREFVHEPEPDTNVADFRTILFGGDR